ncbi:MAG: S1 RNA-binding domain-containing protein, partial [Candidatus Pacebacteria bacterium]|nr:S1 RNA-binding domain-containing protein [Candidatus Paceibacterota bacterium]
MTTDTLEENAATAEDNSRARKEKSLAYNEGAINPIMSSIIKKSPTPPEVGTIVEGPVVNIDKASLFVDLHPFGTGIIYGREFINTRDVIRKINIGDTIAAKIVEIENENGYVELSLKEARQAIIWEEAEKAIISKMVLELPVKDANKGGLI